MIKIISNLRWETPQALKDMLNNIEVKHENNLIVRWGVSGQDNDQDNTIILNPGEALNVAVNKFTQLQKLQDYQDDFLHVPKVWEKHEDVDIFPAIGRPVAHRAGLSFWIFNEAKDIAKMFRKVRLGRTKKQCAEYYAEMLNIQDEYRVHVFYDGVNGRRYRVLRINKKVHEPVPNHKNQNIVRCHRNGWHFDYVRADADEYKVIRKAARRAVKSLGLHFGAVDIGTTNEGKAYVFEVNTAPGLDNGGLERYFNFMKNQYENLNKWKEPIINADN